MTKANTTSKSTALTGADILALIGNNRDSAKPITARVVNGSSIALAKIGAAFAASGDNFSAHYDMARGEYKALANIELQREAERVAQRINDAMANA